MQNKQIFNNYDMVVSMKQEMINDQLTHLQRLGVIERKLILVQEFDGDNYDYKILDSPDKIPRDKDGNPKYAYLNVTVHPQVKIKESGQKIIFVLEFKDGKAAFWKGTGPMAKLKQYDVSDWKYGVAVDLGLKQLEQKHIGKGIKVPDDVKKQLNKFSEDMFRIDHLFMDFESSSLMEPDETETETPGDLVTQQLAEFMHYYLTDLQRDGNPYILGYSLNTTDDTKMPKEVPKSMKPTGTTYTMYNDADTPENSTLNFILVTEGGHKKIHDVPDPFDSNWIKKDEQCDAKMIYSHDVLLEEFLLKPFFDKLRNGVYDKIKGDVSVGKGVPYEKAKHTRANGLRYSIVHDNYGNDQYENYYTVDVKNKKSQVDLKFDGTVRVYKKVNRNMGFCTAEAHSSATANWHGTVTIKATKDSKGNPKLDLNTHDFKVTKDVDSDKNTCAEAFKWIGQILGGIFEAFTFFADQGYMLEVMDYVFNLKVPHLGNPEGVFGYLPDAPRAVIILPAGQEFFFKNPGSNSAGDFELELTYKSQN